MSKNYKLFVLILATIGFQSPLAYSSSCQDDSTETRILEEYKKKGFSLCSMVGPRKRTEQNSIFDEEFLNRIIDQ